LDFLTALFVILRMFMSPPRFVHLQVHSDFSMIDGIAKVKPLVKACVENNMVAMGLTDFTNFCGLVRFYGEALSSGVKPIIGADVLVQSELCGEERFRLTLLAKNNEGYKNITLLLSKVASRTSCRGDCFIRRRQWRCG